MSSYPDVPSNPKVPPKVVFFLCIAACLAGYYGDGNTCTHCPGHTYLTTWTSSTTAADCTACEPGYSTEGATGQSVCGSCTAGYYGDGSTCTACLADTYLVTWTSSSTVADCTACSTGYTTEGATGQTSCPGLYPVMS